MQIQILNKRAYELDASKSSLFDHFVAAIFLLSPAPRLMRIRYTTHRCHVCAYVINSCLSGPIPSVQGAVRCILGADDSFRSKRSYNNV